MVENAAPQKAWEALVSQKQTRLVDVRTDAEWNFVGVPDLSEAGKQAVLIPWQMYPTMQVNTGFIDHMRKAGITPDDTIYFLCRSGARSTAAAHAAIEAGFPNSINVADGFEGPPDSEGHRGTIAGWKAAGLPWQQR
jgi:rhodanese-related sulfurtransferase